MTEIVIGDWVFDLDDTDQTLVGCTYQGNSIPIEVARIMMTVRSKPVIEIRTPEERV